MDRQLALLLRTIVLLMTRRNRRGEAAADKLREGLFCFHLPGGFAISLPGFGEVTEWSIVPDSKSGVPQGTVGSNPTLSATFLCEGGPNGSRALSI